MQRIYIVLPQIENVKSTNDSLIIIAKFVIAVKWPPGSSCKKETKGKWKRMIEQKMPCLCAGRGKKTEQLLHESMLCLPRFGRGLKAGIQVLAVFDHLHKGGGGGCGGDLPQGTHVKASGGDGEVGF